MDKPREPRLSAFFAPIHDPALDADPAPARELERLHMDDLAAQHRAIILSQRPWRIVVASTLVVVAFLGSAAPPTMAILAIWASYAALAYGVPAVPLVRHADAPTNGQWLPAVVVTIDLLVLIALFAVSKAPIGHGLLLTATFLVWLAGFHFGWKLATYAAVVAAVVFSATAGRLGIRNAAADMTIFAVISVVVIAEQARFRKRLSQLSVFCRRVADGDIGLRMELNSSRQTNSMDGLARDVDAMRRGLAEQIGHDALTGCLNRRAMESRLRGECRLARRRNSILSVLAIDVDHFKQINDTYGHPAGDEVLQRLTAIMKGVTRDSDIVARLGGDEFVIALPDTDEDGATILAERLRQQVSTGFFGTDAAPIQVTLSVGAASTHGDSATPTEILAAADCALYQSKHGGRNRVSVNGSAQIFTK